MEHANTLAGTESYSSLIETKSLHAEGILLIIISICGLLLRWGILDGNRRGHCFLRQRLETFVFGQTMCSNMVGEGFLGMPMA